jgi:hypothetical protein
MKSDQSPLQQPIRVINIGLESFAEDLRDSEIPVVQMDWRPPAGGDMRLVALLDSLAEEA